MSAPRVAIVGAGLMGRWHAHAAEAAGAEVVAIVDQSTPAARELADRHGSARHAHELSEVVGDVHVVHVCTPLDSHAALAREALAEGRHVIVEKPLAEDLATTVELIALARDRDRLLVPVHQFPFQRGVQAILERRLELGELARVDFDVRTAGADGEPADERRAVLLGILPHAVSLFRAILAEDFHVDEIERTHLDDDELEVAGSAGDVRLSVNVSLRARPTRNELEVAGTGGTARADLFHGHAIFERGDVSRKDKILRPLRVGGSMVAKTTENLARRAVRNELAYPGLRALFEEVYRTIDEGGPAPIPAEEILQAARLMERVSAATPA